jgi:hypothetical protein
MFEGFNITDILGTHNINNDTSFIILTNDNLYKFLDKIKVIQPYNIYRVNLNKLTSKIYKSTKNNFDINNFTSVGDLCSTDSRFIKQILLANKHIVPFSKKYTKIGKIGESTMWISEMKRKSMESRSLGVIVTNNSSPPDFATPVLPKSYLIKMDFGKTLLKGNDFNILNIQSDGLWIIIREKFTNNNLLILMNNKYNIMNNNYSPISDDKYLESNNKYLESNNKKKMTLTNDNELMINNKCLEVTKSNKIILTKCNKSSTQKWSQYGDNFIYNINGINPKCIVYDDFGNIKLKNYKITDTYWSTISGKTLILKNRDKPWFINKKEQFINKNLLKEKINFPNKKIPIKTKENKSNTSNSFIIILLIIIILILVIVKINKK